MPKPVLPVGTVRQYGRRYQIKTDSGWQWMPKAATRRRAQKTADARTERIVSFRVPVELYPKLQTAAQALGHRSVSAYARTVLFAALRRWEMREIRREGAGR